MALVLLLHGSYRTGYTLLLVSAVLALASILVARYYFPKPHDLEKTPPLETKGFSRSYWWYMLAGGCIAAGFSDFALIGYYFQKSGAIATDLIPVYYAVGVSALLGHWYLAGSLTRTVLIQYSPPFSCLRSLHRWSSSATVS